MTNTLTVTWKKSKTVSFASSVMKNIIPPLSHSRSASSGCFLRKSVAIIL